MSTETTKISRKRKATDKNDENKVKKTKLEDKNSKYYRINKAKTTLLAFTSDLTVSVETKTKGGNSVHSLTCNVGGSDLPLSGPIGFPLALDWVGKREDEKYFHIKGKLPIVASLKEKYGIIGMDLDKEQKKHLLEEGFDESTILAQLNLHRLFLQLHKSKLSNSCAYEYDERGQVKLRTNWKKDEEGNCLNGIFKDDFNCMTLRDGQAEPLLFTDTGLNIGYNGSYVFVNMNPWVYKNTKGFSKKGEMSTIFFMSDLLVIYEENKMTRKEKPVVDISQMYDDDFVVVSV